MTPVAKGESSQSEASARTMGMRWGPALLSAGPRIPSRRGGARPSPAEAAAQRHHTVHVLARVGQHALAPDRLESLAIGRDRLRDVVAGVTQQLTEVEHARVDVVGRRARV